MFKMGAVEISYIIIIIMNQPTAVHRTTATTVDISNAHFDVKAPS